MANSIKKTKGSAIKDPTEVKRTGWLKSTLICAACVAALAVSAFGGAHMQEHVFQDNSELERLEQVVVEMGTERDELQGIISEKDQQIAEKDQEIADQQQEIDEQQKEIDDLKAQQGQGGENNNGNENVGGGENNGGNGNAGGENDNENENGNGGEQGGVQEEVVDLTQEEQATIAAGIYTDLRSDIDFDASTIEIEGTKLVAGESGDYLQAYISIMEGGEKVMYVIGYEGIDKAEDIPTADVRMIKAGTVADVEKFVSVEKYVADADLDATKTYFAETAGTTKADDVYVRISSTNRKGKFTSTTDFITVEGDTINTGSIQKEGHDYNLSYIELVEKLVAEGVKTAEATNDAGMTK